jgi:RNA polymerase sigma factor (sigma-70 family)
VSRILLFYPCAEDGSVRTFSTVRMPSSPELDEWPVEELERIRSIFSKLTRRRVDNPADAEDLVQETFLTMAARCPQVDIEKGLLIWGLGVLRRKVGNYYRRTQRHGAVIVESLSDEAVEAQVTATAESALNHAELLRLVDDIVARFPPHEKEVVALMLEGLATSEIVEELRSQRYQTVVNRAHRGRRKLHRELAKHGYGPAFPMRRARSRRAHDSRPGNWQEPSS